MPISHKIETIIKNYEYRNGIIYFDNNATTKIAPEVLYEMLPYLVSNYGNPSSLYKFSNEVLNKMNESREKVADLLNCSSDEIIFTSCGSESNNSAILSALQTNPNKRHIITTEVEHPAIKNPLTHLKEKGYKVTSLNVDNKGQLDIQQLEDSITDNTALISIMYANNETGVIFDIPKISEIARNKGVLFHTDAVQAVGKIPIDLQKLPVDFLSLSGHKIHAPKGVGALFVRNNIKFSSFLKGGHQENGRRAGTENVTSIIGLGKAAELSKKNLVTVNNQIKILRDELENNLLDTIPDIQINGDLENRLSNTSNISFKYVEGESILFMLDKNNICISTGSACSSHSLEPSHVLKAMKIQSIFLNGSIRISLSRYTTKDEIKIASETIPKIIYRLRQLSPFCS
ncbi:MAG: cysteine desulfurase NifS [Candidatus Cloacimonetes bacterium]|jgi:cysteine desulfurase|nr:cysteine desulfurase NifS [Candidatus Cloacimonadota bacterium]